MTRKIITILLLVLLVTSPKFCHSGFKTDVKAGDIVCWRSDSIEFLDIDLPIPLFELLHFTFPILTHADIVVDEDGTLRTSIQKKGVCTSNIEKRYEQCNLGILLRNRSLTEAQIDSVLDTAYELDADYDYGGYDGLIMDFLLFWDILRLYTSILQSPDDLYCSEYTALCFENNGIKVSHRNPSLTSPLDIYRYALNPFISWEIIDICILD